MVWSVSLAGDEGGHGCAVTVVVVPGGCYAFDHVASFEDCTGQVRVVAIDTGVDDGDYDPFSAGNSVDLLNAKEAQMRRMDFNACDAYHDGRRSGHQNSDTNHQNITWVFPDQKLMLLFNAMMFLDLVKESQISTYLI